MWEIGGAYIDRNVHTETHYIIIVNFIVQKDLKEPRMRVHVIINRLSSHYRENISVSIIAFKIYVIFIHHQMHIE